MPSLKRLLNKCQGEPVAKGRVCVRKIKKASGNLNSDGLFPYLSGDIVS